MSIASRRFAVFSFLVATFAAGHAFSAQQSDGADQLHRAAPENCWLYSAWTNVDPDPSSSNAAEQLMAEQEVQKFVDQLKQMLPRLISAALSGAPEDKQQMANAIMPKLLRSLSGSSGSICIEKVILVPDGPPDVHGSVLIKTAADPEDLIPSLVELISTEDFRFEATEISGSTFFNLKSEEQAAPEITIGSASGFLVVGFNRKSATETIQRMSGGEPPRWLQELDKRTQMAKRSSMGFINVAEIREALLPLGDRRVAEIIETLGLANLSSIESGVGYSEMALVSRIGLRFNGQMDGIFNLFGDGGIEPTYLNNLPADSLFAFGMSLDPGKLLAFTEDSLGRYAPREKAQFDNAMGEAESAIGVNFRDDVLPHLGSTFVIANGAADGWLTGTTVTASVADGEKLRRSINQFFDGAAAGQLPPQFAPRAVTSNYAGSEIQTFRLQQFELPIAPSWSITDDRLVGSLYPAALPTALGTLEFERLTTVSEFADHVGAAASDGDLLAFTYIDAQTQFEYLHPYAQLILGFVNTAISQSGDLPPEASAMISEMTTSLRLPPARVIHRHIRPAVSVVRRTSDGLQLETTQTLPMVDLTVAVPVAIGMLLPAVQQVRVAARRTESANNLRQLALAAHNHESAYMHMPPAWTENDEGESLLSWRVRILPFLESSNLYDQFRHDEPWDSEHNLRLLDQMPAVFRSPSSTVMEPGMTVYRAVGGDRGIIGPPKDKTKGRSFREIMDGTSNTVMFIEASDELAVPWTKPESGIDPENIDPQQLLQMHPGGTNAAFGDGSIQFLPNTLDAETLRKLFMMNDGEIVDRYDW